MSTDGNGSCVATVPGVQIEPKANAHSPSGHIATDAPAQRPVRVLFYSHSIHNGRQPNLWYILLDWAGRVVSPRYTRCTLQVGDTIYCVTRDGWRRVPARTYAFPPAAIVDTLADMRPLECAGIPETSSFRRLTIVQIIAGYVFPRRADHCSTLIGEVLGFGRVRTPDRLHDLLVRRGAGLPQSRREAEPARA